MAGRMPRLGSGASGGFPAGAASAPTSSWGAEADTGGIAPGSRRAGEAMGAVMPVGAPTGAPTTTVLTLAYAAYAPTGAPTRTWRSGQLFSRSRMLGSAREISNL